MSPVIVITDEERPPAAGHMGIADYLRDAGEQLPPGTRVLFGAAPTKQLYECALIATARGHRPFPAVDDLAQSQWPDLAGDIPLRKGSIRADATSRRPVVGVLHDPTDALAPSCRSSLEQLRGEFERLQIDQVVIDPRNRNADREIDALFVRAHTSPGKTAWRWSLAARRAGIPVIDDPDSILRCCSKLFMMESFRRHSIPAPRSCAVFCEEDLERAFCLLGSPMVLKTPGSSFSKGVFKVDSVNAARVVFAANRIENPIMVAQEFLPTRFDWRIGVLGQEALYACRYFMAPNHWQIFKAESNGLIVEGRGQAIGLQDAPRDVVALAVRAANCIGKGLYGVDIKVVNGQPVVIEVNDNPTIESDLEAAIDPVWPRLARHFSLAIAEQREQARPEMKRTA